MGVTWQNMPRALVAQSIPILPELLWQRVFTAVWLLGCLVATSAYTCNLVSIFTSITYPSRLRTLQELADSDYRVALLNNGGFLAQLVLLTPGDMLDQIRQKLDLFNNLNEALKAVKERRHAFIADETTTKLTIMQQMQDDEWYLVNERLYSGRLVWYFPKNTPWKQKFDQNIRRLNYFGLITHWFEVEFAEWVKDNVNKKVRRGDGREGPAPSLTMRHLQGVFYILGVAWIVSGAVLLLELFTQYQCCHRELLCSRLDELTPYVAECIWRMTAAF
ncbi:uncharacterized protein LOC135104184 [Scylla paramamosain]|uniref:uncharacterized protein LOC135104184 n=1 Tax=Scylla paramamosain TaxID=85552 RepID=UPI0030835D9F